MVSYVPPKKGERKSADLTIDGLNLAHYALHNKQEGKETEAEIAHLVARMCKVLFARERLYINLLYIIGGVDEEVAQLEERIKEKHEVLSSKEQQKEEILEKIQLKEKEKKDLPFIDILKRKRINDEIKNLNSQLQRINEEIISIESEIISLTEEVKKKWLYSTTFWNNVRDIVGKYLQENGINIHGIRLFLVKLKRKNINHIEKREKDDDIAMAGLIGWYFGKGWNLAVYSNDKRLLETTIKVGRFMSKDKSPKLVILTWHTAVAEDLKKTLKLPVYAIGEKPKEEDTTVEI